jgi:hypothetical protein
LLSTVAAMRDDVGDTFGTASPLPRQVTTGTRSRSAAINEAGDRDVFRFASPTTGVLVVRMTATQPDDLDSTLTIFDAYGQLIAADDDGGGDNYLDSVVRFKATAGSTYYLRAQAYDALGTGAYTLAFGEDEVDDDAGDTFRTAASVDLTETDVVFGSIEVAGDRDFYRFVAPASGRLLVRMEGNFTSGLDTCLTVYSASHRLLASNDDLYTSTIDPSLSTTDSGVRLDVVRGHAYFVKASALATFAGDYELVFTDDHDDTLAGATPVGAQTVVMGSLAGSIERPTDRDVFRIVAPRTGMVDVRLEWAPDSDLDPVLTIYDASGNLLAWDDDSGGYSNSAIWIKMIAGRTYYAVAQGYDGSTGGYYLSFRPFDPGHFEEGPWYLKGETPR